jgi:hypothetical protein
MKNFDTDFCAYKIFSDTLQNNVLEPKLEPEPQEPYLFAIAEPECGFGSGSNIEWNCKSKIQNERLKFWEIMLLSDRYR